MNKRVKAEWVAALRSGNYKQGPGYLHTKDTFCCLGVLLDCQIPATGGRWASNIAVCMDFELLGEQNLGRRRCLPRKPSSSYSRHMHREPDDDLLSFGISEYDEKRLVKMNDAHNPYSFENIADWIEENL
jgi:hypothetical protein